MRFRLYRLCLYCTVSVYFSVILYSVAVMERVPYRNGTHYLTMYLHTYRSVVDVFLMFNSTSLGFEPDFFNFHCQRFNHSAVEVLYTSYACTVLDILALLIHEDESTILYKTKSLNGTKP